VAAVLALAAAPFAAHAEPRTPTIWYRSSEGCPDGEAFVARLRGAAARAQLAGVTDRIDFVVTLGRAGEKSSGRLERQTAGSTIALREIEADTCDAAADVLALTLTLALDPAATPPSEVAAPPVTEAVAAAAAARAPEPVERPSESSPPTQRNAPAARSAPDANRSVSAPRWSLGAEVGGVTGPTGALGPRVGAFVEMTPRFAALPRASARVSALISRVEDEGAGLAFSTLHGRLDGCPVAFGGAALAVAPCIGLELGVASAEGLDAEGRDDTGVWAAAAGLIRLSWQVAPGFAVSLDGGAFAPVVRYSFSSESGSVVHHADSVGLFGALGAAWVLP
jgi:hypothetical protein